jgi:hypothetical protein
MKKLSLLLLALPLAACAQDVFDRPNTTQAEFNRDQAACKSYADARPPAVVTETSLGPDVVPNIAKRQKDMDGCLEAKGYALESKF